VSQPKHTETSFDAEKIEIWLLNVFLLSTKYNGVKQCGFFFPAASKKETQAISSKVLFLKYPRPEGDKCEVCSFHFEKG